MADKVIECCVGTCDSPLDQSFWDTQWEQQKIGWDLGSVSPAIAAYMDQYADKAAAILIPGCGNAHEAAYLVEQNFTNITLIDISPTAVKLLQQKFKNAAEITIICEDFFQHQGKYDLIIEQTFFCAIAPDRRNAYADKTASLLNPGGKIIGLLFDRIFTQTGPPFGGTVSEYLSIFQPHFEIKKMEACANSVVPRAGTEVFINMIKK